MSVVRSAASVAVMALLAVSLSACGGPGGDTTCSDFLSSSSSDQTKAVSAMKDHFTATFGSEDNTVNMFVQALDQNCKGRGSSKIKDVLYNLGYYGN